MVRPGAALDASALNTIVWPTCGFVGEITNTAVGAAVGVAVTDCVVEAAMPRALVTVSVTANDPAFANACVAVEPDAVEPSPKLHAKELIAGAELGHAPLN